MATSLKPSLPAFDVRSTLDDARDQFRDLNPNEPGQWPILPKLAVWTALAIAVVVVGWFLLLSTAQEELDAERAKEPTLKADYRSKLTQAVNLEELLKQKRQVEEYVLQLEKQLPGKAEMAALLSDINQAGIGRGSAVRAVQTRPGRRARLLRRAADLDQGQRPLSRHGRIRRRHREPVAHRDAAQHEHRRQSQPIRAACCRWKRRPAPTVTWTRPRSSR